MRIASLVAGASIPALFVFAAWSQDPSTSAQEPRVVPDQHITPGMVASSDQNEVCSTAGGTYSHRHRLSQNEQTKHEVLDRYGVAWGDRARYEDDHDVPLSLGGSDDVANRWPQPRFGTWTSAQKDKLEAEAWRMVCHEHTITLIEGQAYFLAPADWRVAYCKLFKDTACASLSH